MAFGISACFQSSVRQLARVDRFRLLVFDKEIPCPASQVVVSANTHEVRDTGNMMTVGKRFLRYCHRVYGLGDFLRGVKLGSPAPARIPAWPKLLAVLIGIWTRRGSLHRLERLMVAGRLRRLLGRNSFISADTLGQALNEADARLFRHYNDEIIRKARHNKVFGTGTVDGWMVAALDGTQTYATQRPPKAARKDWKRRHLGNGVTEYYEMAVGLSYVGFGPRLALGIGRIRKGEGEVAAGLRLIKERDEQLGWAWCDVVCADALYASGPFINEVRARHKHVIVRAKEKLHIIDDARGLFDQRPPDIRMQDATPRSSEERFQAPSTRYQVEIWDGEDFTSWDSVNEPLRCLKVRQVREDYRNGQWIAQEAKDSFIITTLPQDEMKAETVWRIMHLRWDIENSLFNDLKQNWAFEHCYIHGVRGIEAVYALYSIAFNLKLLFAYRQLGYGRKRGPTLVELADLFLMDFGHCVWTWSEVLAWRSAARAGPG